MPTLLSITKPFATIPSKILPTSQQHHVQSFIFSPIKSSNNNTNNNTSNEEDNAAATPPRPALTPPDTVEIRFRRGSKRRRKGQEDGFVGGGMSMKSEAKPPKEWESMTLTEKAIELYMGEKGMLFWLNKFAYASIFIIIGGWIVFRFVGPALNLYQLDTPPLAPNSMFKS